MSQPVPKVVHCELDISDTELARMVQGTNPAQSANILHESAEQVLQPTQKGEAPAARPQQSSNGNPLLTPHELELIVSQEKMSSFLTGIAVTAAIFGGYHLLKWMFSNPEVAEAASEMNG
jgi:hypothetical protein